MAIETTLIIGAGMAGLMAAERLQAAGVAVTLLDKGRNVGGRMATRRLESAQGIATFDHGAQYFTIQHPQMARFLRDWQAAGVIRAWSEGFYSADGVPHFNGVPRWIGTTGMTALPKYLARSLNVISGVRVVSVEWQGGFVARTEDGRIFSAESLLLTPPVPQSLTLLDSGNITLPAAERQALELIAYDPCLALLVMPAGPVRIPEPGGLWPISAEPASWLADNRQKGISAQPAVTVHAGRLYSRAHFDSDSATIAADLISPIREWLGTATPDWQLQRWRYSIPVQLHPQRTQRVSAPGPLWFAGDAFAGPRVEGAALSGLAAAEALLAA